jgi:hypothetical protein
MLARALEEMETPRMTTTQTAEEGIVRIEDATPLHAEEEGDRKPKEDKGDLPPLLLYLLQTQEGVS